MRFLVISISLLVVIIVATLAAVNDPGYVLISRQPWRVEMSLTLFILLVILLMIALAISVRFLKAVWMTPRGVKIWRRQRSIQRAQKAMVKGYLGLIEGQWNRAERDLLQALPDNPTPVMNYLAAAYSAHQRGDWMVRDQHIDHASRLDIHNQFAIHLAHARMQYQAGQLQAALETCQRLQRTNAKNPQLLELLIELYVKLECWRLLLNNMPLLVKKQILGPLPLKKLERQAVHGVLQQQVEEDPDKLVKVWQKLSPAQRSDVENLKAYCTLLIAIGHNEAVDRQIRQALKKQWLPALVELYGQFESANSAQQFRWAEALTLEHPEDPVLMLALGRLAMRNQLWGKARSYLETCVANGGDPQAYRLLGQLAEQLGESQEALKYYKSGLGLEWLEAGESSLSGQPAETGNSQDAALQKSANLS